MSKEKNLTICKSCNTIKYKIAAGKFPNRKDTKYVDEDGAMWNGRECPLCVRNRSKNHMRKKRAIT